MKGNIIFALIVLIVVFGVIYVFDSRESWEEEAVVLDENENVVINGVGGGYNVQILSGGIG